MGKSRDWLIHGYHRDEKINVVTVCIVEIISYEHCDMILNFLNLFGSFMCTTGRMIWCVSTNKISSRNVQWNMNYHYQWLYVFSKQLPWKSKEMQMLIYLVRANIIWVTPGIISVYTICPTPSGVTSFILIAEEDFSAPGETAISAPIMNVLHFTCHIIHMLRTIVASCDPWGL